MPEEEQLDLLWGAEEIGRVIGRKPQATHRLLQLGLIKSARKIGRRYVADREKLRLEFLNEPQTNLS